MTAELAEVPQLTPKEEHQRDVLFALAALHKAAAQCIMDELAEAFPALDVAEEKAAGCLRSALEALAAPQAALAALDGEIERVEGACSEWAARLDVPAGPGQSESRVEARRSFAAWSDELAELRRKRDFAEAGMLPLLDARNKARADVELAQGARRGLEAAILQPFDSPVAHATKAYIAFRQPYLHLVILSGDRTHPEWEMAIAQLEELCKASGYRTDHLPSIGEAQAAAMTAAMANGLMDAMSDPAPSMGDLIALDKAAWENRALQEHPVRDIERRTIAPGPREVPQRPYMEVQTLRDVGIR